MTEFEKPGTKEFETTLPNDLRLAQKVFRSYRETLLSNTGTVAASKKQDGSDVTALDVEIEDTLRQSLISQFPGITVLGEETGYGAISSEDCVLIDPIDGTSSFIEGTPTFTNMYAHIRDRRVVSSLIYNPSLDNEFIAIKGGGAFKNSSPLNLTQVGLPQIILCKKEFIEPLKQLLGDGFEYQVPPSGGGHGLTLVAEGAVAARFQLHASGIAHDYAPGGLLVEEAGGVNIPILQDKYTFDCNSFVACHPLLAERISDNIEAIRQLERS